MYIKIDVLFCANNKLNGKCDWNCSSSHLNFVLTIKRSKVPAKIESPPESRGSKQLKRISLSSNNFHTLISSL